MWNNSEVHFAGDYFFQSAAFGTSTDAQYSESFQLGTTEGGLRVHGWIEGAANCLSGSTITTVLEAGDVEGSTDSTDWAAIASNTVTATGTSITGDIFSFVPDVKEKYMRVSVANASGVSGAFSVAVEYLPR